MSFEVQKHKSNTIKDGDRSDLGTICWSVPTPRRHTTQVLFSRFME